MNTLADIILILSVFGLIIGMAKPDIFKGQTRKSLAIKFSLGIIIGLVMLAVFAPKTPTKANSQTSTKTTTTQQPKVDTTTPAYKLADYDLNNAPDSATVAQYQAALDSVKPLCAQDEERIAAITYGSWTDLKQHGITDENNLALLNHLKASIPANTAPVDCQGVYAAYLTLREPQ